MSTPHTVSRAAIAVAIAGITATLFTGCFPNPADLVNRGVEEAIEGATGGDVSLDELPADFPASVPVIDGEIAVAAGAGGAEGWVVVITSPAADPVAEAVSELQAAGFTEDTSMSAGGTGAVVYSNAEYLVFVAGEGETVSYTVTAKQ